MLLRELIVVQYLKEMIKYNIQTSLHLQKQLNVPLIK